MFLHSARKECDRSAQLRTSDARRLRHVLVLRASCAQCTKFVWLPQRPAFFDGSARGCFFVKAFASLFFFIGATPLCSDHLFCVATVTRWAHSGAFSGVCGVRIRVACTFLPCVLILSGSSDRISVPDICANCPFCGSCVKTSAGHFFETFLTFRSGQLRCLFVVVTLSFGSFSEFQSVVGQPFFLFSLLVLLFSDQHPMPFFLCSVCWCLVVFFLGVCSVRGVCAK